LDKFLSSLYSHNRYTQNGFVCPECGLYTRFLSYKIADPKLACKKRTVDSFLLNHGKDFLE
jgi:hypothetical protein